MGFQRDRVAVNGAALNILKTNYVGSKNLSCMSHTLVNAGKILKYENASVFVRTFVL